MLFVARMSLCILSTRNKVTLPRNYIVLSIYKFNYSLADLTDLRRRNPKTTRTTNCLSLRNNAACCIPLRDLRHLRENNHIRVLKLSPKKPQCISLIYADKALITTTTTNCLSLRNNAACGIPLRDLRNLRENIHARILNQSTQTKISHADPTDKPQK